LRETSNPQCPHTWLGGWTGMVSTTLENEADPTLENEATGVVSS